MKPQTITINGGDLVLPLTPQQEEVYSTVERYLVLPKGRRFGATSSIGAMCVDWLVDGYPILWVDTVQINCDKYFKKYFLPLINQIKPEYWGYRQSKDLRILKGVLDFRSAEKPQNIEGFAYKKIIINEAGIVLKGQKGRDLWFNTIRPMAVDYKADVYFLGTPKGKKAKKDEAPAKTTLYYELACKGGLEDPDYNHYLSDHTELSASLAAGTVATDEEEDSLSLRQIKKDPNWKTIQVSMYDNPLLDPLEIKEMEADVPRVTRQQEIYGKFIDVGDEDVFHEEWFPVVYELPPIHQWIRKIISLDTAFKKGAENDDTAMVCFLETLVGYFWLDTFCEKLEFPELVKKAKEFYLKHAVKCFPEDYLRLRPPDWKKPKHGGLGVSLVLIEDKATGTPLIQTFRSEFPYPIKAITPITDKYNRAVAVTPYFETGTVSMLFGAWNDPSRDQLCDFNAALDTPDDIVDGVTQYFNYIGSTVKPRAPMTSRKREHKSKILKGYLT